MVILRYSAEVRRIQQSNKGKDIAESVTAIIGQPLIQLKTSIKKEEAHLYHWLVLDQHLHRRKKAEATLNCLDKLIVDIQEVRDTIDMLNLSFTKGAFFGSFEDQYENKCLPRTRIELL